MKSYSIDEIKDFNKELIPMLKGQEVHHPIFGTGRIINVAGLATDTPGIVMEIAFSTKTATFIISRKLISSFREPFFTNNVTNMKMNEVFDIAEAIDSARSAQIREAEKEARELKAAEDKQKKLQIRYEKTKSRVLTDLQNMKRNCLSREFSKDTYWYAIGWLAKNAGTVSATIPDYTEKWFNDTFGTEAPRKTVDSTLYTSGGYAMKWHPSFSMGLKSVENMPELLTKFVSGKRLNNTNFIYELITDYGFEFGKSQNLAKIKDAVPERNIADFEAGYTCE